MADGPQIEGRLSPGAVAGETKIEARIKQEPRETAFRRFAKRIFKSEKAKAPAGIMGGLFVGLEEVLGELSEHHTIKDITALFNKEKGMQVKSNRRTEAAGVLTAYLGEYDPDTGTFTGGLEAQSEAYLDENQKVLDYLDGRGETGYGDFSQVAERLIILYGEIHQIDKKFANVNSQKGQKGKEYVDLTQLTSKEKRITWISKTFGVEEGKVEELWNQAIVARMASSADEINGPRMWEDFIKSWKEVGYTDQIAILGLLQITEAQGIENFLGDEVKDEDGNRIAAVALGGEKLRGVSQQLYEMVLAFMDSESDKGKLRYETGVGIRLDNLSLRDRFLSRISLDFNTALSGVDASGDFGLTRYLIERYRPTSAKGINPWEELVARAKFETAFHDRYRGTVNVGQRITDARIDKASYDNVAGAEIVRNEWFGLITGFKEAVAKRTLDRTNPDSAKFDQMMKDATDLADLVMIRKLRRADTYAKQFLEMSGAPVDGFSTDRDYTFVQIWDSVRSASSGPVSERLPAILQVPLERLIEQKRFRYLIDSEKGELIMSFEGAKGVFTISMAGDARVSEGAPGKLQYNSKKELSDFIHEKGNYKQGGYWPEMEHAWGAGFNLMPRDYLEFCGRLSRTHLEGYQRREAWRRLGEEWTGSNRQKRAFIQFLAERKQVLGGTTWGIPFKTEFGGPINTTDSSQLVVLAKRLKIYRSQSSERLVDLLSNPATWDLYFDPLKSEHLDGIASQKVRHGFDRFDKVTEWAFKSASELRVATKTLSEFISRGVIYKDGVWTGTTIRDIDKLVSEFWIHVRPWESYESLTHVYQTINEEMTRELEQAIERPHEVSHAQLSKMFDDGLWRVAELTPEEKDEVLLRGTLDGERLVPSTPEEIREGKTILGSAMELKGYREKRKLRVKVDQSLWMDLMANPAVSLQEIYTAMINDHMFEYCAPYLPEGDLERLYENPSLFLYMDFSDPRAYEIIDRGDPRFSYIRDHIVASLFAIDSGRTSDTFVQDADNARNFNWPNMSAHGNHGWMIKQVRQLTGLNNITSPRVQLDANMERCKRPDWRPLKGKEFAYLDESIVRFADMYYGINLRNIREVAGLGPQFRSQFDRIIANPVRLIFSVYGANMDRPAEIPSTYEFYQKQILQSFYHAVYPNGGASPAVPLASIATPQWFEDIPAITGVAGNVICPAITYDTVVRKLAELAKYDPVYGPWLEANINIDYARVAEVSSLEFQTPETSTFKAISPTLKYLKDLADLPGVENLPYGIEKKFLPQVERYALRYMREITVEGETINLDGINIRRYIPQVLAQFKQKLKNGDGTYNFNFVGLYLNVMYGIEIKNEDLDIGWKGIETSIQRDDDLGIGSSISSCKGYGGYIDHLGGVIEKMRQAAKDKLTMGQRVAEGLPRIPDEIFYTQLVHLEDLREKLRFSINGPSEWFKIIRRVQDRNADYFTTGFIWTNKTQYLPKGDEWKYSVFEDKLRTGADIETVLIADDNLKRTVRRGQERLMSIFRLNNTEMVRYIGRPEARGLEDLRSQLYTPEGKPLFSLKLGRDKFGNERKWEPNLNWAVNRVKLYNWGTYSAFDPIHFVFLEVVSSFIKGVKPVSDFAEKYIALTPFGLATAVAGDGLIATAGIVGSAAVTGNPFVMLKAIGEFGLGGVIPAIVASLALTYGFNAVHRYILTPITNRLVKARGVYVANRDEAAGYNKKKGG